MMTPQGQEGFSKRAPAQLSASARRGQGSLRTDAE